MLSSREEQGDKNAFFNEQCKKKKKEENNKMEKTGDLPKKIGETKGIFHSKMDIKKGRNCMDLTETEEIKKWWQENTEDLYKEILMTRKTWTPKSLQLVTASMKLKDACSLEENL